jgi:hypothetical protein
MENNKLSNAIAIFGLENGQYKVTDIKLVYRRLARDNHPDKGGNTEKMQLINNAYTEFCKYFASNETLDINQEENEKAQEFDFSFIDTLKVMQGLIIEVCGYWVWLSGNTFPFRDILKELGFKYSGSKKSWYWSPTVNVASFRRGSKSMKNIRKEFGSQIIDIEQQQAIN